MSIQWATLERVHGEGARGSSSELTDVVLRWEAVSITNAGDAAERREALPGAEAAGNVATRRERVSDTGAGEVAARWDRAPDTGEGVARW